MEHLEDCAVGQAEALGITLHPDGSYHRWSGWPGAFCLDCHTEDPMEICLGGCPCPCHTEFWDAYIQEMGESDVAR